MVIISTHALVLIWIKGELERVIEATERQQGEFTSPVCEQEARAGPEPLLCTSPLLIACGMCPSLWKFSLCAFAARLGPSFEEASL